MSIKDTVRVIYYFLILCTFSTIGQLCAAESSTPLNEVQSEHRDLKQHINRLKRTYADEFYAYYHRIEKSSFTFDLTLLQSLSMVALSAIIMLLTEQLKAIKNDENKTIYATQRLSSILLSRTTITGTPTHDELSSIENVLQHMERAPPIFTIFNLSVMQLIAFCVLLWGAYEAGQTLYKQYIQYHQLKPLQERLNFLESLDTFKDTLAAETHAPLSVTLLNDITSNSTLVENAINGTFAPTEKIVLIFAPVCLSNDSLSESRVFENNAQVALYKTISHNNHEQPVLSLTTPITFQEDKQTQEYSLIPLIPVRISARQAHAVYPTDDKPHLTNTARDYNDTYTTIGHQEHNLPNSRDIIISIYKNSQTPISTLTYLNNRTIADPNNAQVALFKELVLPNADLPVCSLAMLTPLSKNNQTQESALVQPRTLRTIWQPKKAVLDYLYTSHNETYAIIPAYDHLKKFYLTCTASHHELPQVQAPSLNGVNNDTVDAANQYALLVAQQILIKVVLAAHHRLDTDSPCTSGQLVIIMPLTRNVHHSSSEQQPLVIPEANTRLSPSDSQVIRYQNLFNWLSDDEPRYEQTEQLLALSFPTQGLEGSSPDTQAVSLRRVEPALAHWLLAVLIANIVVGQLTSRNIFFDPMGLVAATVATVADPLYWFHYSTAALAPFMPMSKDWLTNKKHQSNPSALVSINNLLFAWQVSSGSSGEFSWSWGGSQDDQSENLLPKSWTLSIQYLKDTIESPDAPHKPEEHSDAPTHEFWNEDYTARKPRTQKTNRSAQNPTPSPQNAPSADLPSTHVPLQPNIAFSSLPSFGATVVKAPSVSAKSDRPASARINYPFIQYPFIQPTYYRTQEPPEQAKVITHDDSVLPLTPAGTMSPEASNDESIVAPEIPVERHLTQSLLPACRMREEVRTINQDAMIPPFKATQKQLKKHAKPSPSLESEKTNNTYRSAIVILFLICIYILYRSGWITLTKR